MEEQLTNQKADSKKIDKLNAELSAKNKKTD